MSDEPHKIVDESVKPASELEAQQNAAASEFEQEKKNTALSMDVKVYSPFKDYYDGQAFSISAENPTGPFDILPQHHNFITLLSPCDLMVRTVQKGDQKIRIGGGIMHVKADKVIVFLDV